MKLALSSKEERFLLAYAGDEVKAYSIKDLTSQEVVNDELNGKPLWAFTASWQILEQFMKEPIVGRSSASVVTICS